MNGDQALQLLPSYQRTIIQQQQELRVITHYTIILYITPPLATPLYSNTSISDTSI